MFEHKVVDSVLLPALFVVLRAEWLFLAVAHGLDALWGDPMLQERLLHRFRATASESNVVFLRSAVVTVSFDENLNARMLREEGCVIFDR